MEGPEVKRDEGCVDKWTNRTRLLNWGETEQRSRTSRVGWLQATLLIYSDGGTTRFRVTALLIYPEVMNKEICMSKEEGGLSFLLFWSFTYFSYESFKFLLYCYNFPPCEFLKVELPWIGSIGKNWEGKCWDG